MFEIFNIVTGIAIAATTYMVSEDEIPFPVLHDTAMVRFKATADWYPDCYLRGFVTGYALESDLKAENGEVITKADPTKLEGWGFLVTTKVCKTGVAESIQPMWGTKKVPWLRIPSQVTGRIGLKRLAETSPDERPEWLEMARNSILAAATKDPAVAKEVERTKKLHGKEDFFAVEQFGR